MLKVEQLRYAYKAHSVLKELSFSATAGECVCVLGENGAGKTTLFRCILGLLQDYCGNIYIDGTDNKHLSVKERAKRISYIPQSHAPTFNYSVYQTVLMGTNILTERFRTPSRKERDMVIEKLDLLGISHLLERGYAELSGGERQLVLIARALVQNTHILIMDEPTANLDYGNQFRMMTQVHKLAQQGYLTLLSTHNPEHALRFADKVLILKNGKIMQYGSPKEVLTPRVLQSIYGVNVEMPTVKATWGDITVMVPQLHGILDQPQTVG